MRTDTERLDWLEQTQSGIYAVVREEWLPKTDGTDKYDIHHKFLGWSLADRFDECRTIRTAIDAGMDNLTDTVFEEDDED